MPKFTIKDKDITSKLLKEAFGSTKPSRDVFNGWYYWWYPNPEYILHKSSSIPYKNNINVKREDGEKYQLPIFIIKVKIVLDKQKIKSYDHWKYNGKFVGEHKFIMCRLCDLIKLFRFANPDVKFEKELESVYQKVLKFDGSSSNKVKVWGTIDRSFFRLESVNLNSNFADFFSAFVKVGYEYAWSYLYSKKKDSNIEASLNSFVTETTIQKILANFQYGTDPYEKKELETFVFDEPKSLEECLNIDKDNLDDDDTWELNQIQKLQNLVTKKISVEKEKQLEEMYNMVLFEDAKHLENDTSNVFIPVFAMRNFYFKKWTELDYKYVVSYYESMINKLKFEKFKHGFSSGILSGSMKMDALERHRENKGDPPYKIWGGQRGTVQWYKKREDEVYNNLMIKQELEMYRAGEYS
jgi:hypothetical protein